MDLVYLFQGSDNEVKDLINAIKNGFLSDKMNALKLGVKNKFFTAKQAFDIVKAFTFDAEQKQACIILYDNLYDKQNVSVMLEALTFSMSKNEVMKALNLTK
jgi:hypothetical protein